MARLTFPSDPMSLRTGPAGGQVRNAIGATAIVYLDAAGTTLADIQTLAGQTIVGSKLTVGASSQLPLFLGPDGVGVLYVSVDGGPLTAVLARNDSLSATVASLSTSVDSLNLSVASLNSSAAAIPGIDSRLTAVESQWVAYAPNWTATTTNPNIGNGAITARYKRIGVTVFYTGRILAGSTTAFGSGNWLVSLPFAANSGTLNVGTGFAFDADGPNHGLVCWLNSSTTLLFTTSSSDVNPTSPQTWAANDQLRWTAIYEAL